MPVETASSYARAVYQFSLENRVDADIMASIFTVESHWDKDASDSNGGGIAEIQVNTGQMVANELNLGVIITVDYLKANPEVSIRLGCRHYRDLLDEFNQDSLWAIKAYNVGAKGARKCPLMGFSYLQAVLAVYKNYEEFKR